MKRCTVVLAVVLIAACGSPPARETVTQTRESEPDEPCRVEAPPAAQAAAQNWCQDGVFTKVNVSTDANNFVVMLQMSTKTQQVWDKNRFRLLNPFRQITGAKWWRRQI